jgi:hypothetical protein
VFSVPCTIKLNCNIDAQTNFKEIMKTQTYLILSAAAIISLTTSCSNSSTNTNDKGNGAATDVQSLLDNRTPKEFKHVIPLDAMKAMVSTYEAERVPLINNNTQLRKTNGENFVDSKNGWVSFDDLAGFVEEVKAAAKNKGLETKDLGVRLYFSVYPQQHDGESAYFGSLENGYRSRQTFLLLPTYHDSKTNFDYDVLSSVTNRSQEIFMGSQGASQGGNVSGRAERSADATAGSAAAQSYIGLNHMALCPPACPN